MPGSIRSLVAICLLFVFPLQTVFAANFFTRLCRRITAAVTPKTFTRIDYVGGVTVVHTNEQAGENRSMVFVGDRELGFDRTNRGVENLRGNYDGEHDPLWRSYPDPFLDFNEMKEKKVADIGAGDGQFVFELLEKGIDAVGIDPLLSDKQKKDPLHFKKALAENLPFAEGELDLIYSNWSVFLYFNKSEDYVKFLKEMTRVLKPGGKIRITPFHYHNLEEVLKQIPELKVSAEIKTKIDNGLEVRTYDGKPWESEYDFIELTKKP